MHAGVNVLHHRRSSAHIAYAHSQNDLANTRKHTNSLWWINGLEKTKKRDLLVDLMESSERAVNKISCPLFFHLFVYVRACMHT
jgi:hypothetical protein